MRTEQDWMKYQCACGFKLERVPRTVVNELPRCLGCGRTLRATTRPRLAGVVNVRDLR